ncbi:MAG: Cna B-type domain-containing protein [Bacilli bacterium]|nr:Cna B-type domain-containing protein [Bacilli bacterium]
MKDSGGNNKKKALSYKTFALVLIAVLSVVFFAFGGWNRVQSAIVDLQKRFADNEEIDGKERTDNGDGTYKLSLSVTGDADTDTRTPHANILIVYDQSGSMLAHLASSKGSFGHTGTLQSSGWEQLYKTRVSHGSGYGRYYTCSNPITDAEEYTGTLYYDSNGNGQGGCTEYSGNRYSAITRAASAEKTVYDFANALLSKNPTSGQDTDAVEMALVTFNTNSPVSGSSDPAQGWTSSKTTFTNLFSNTGTSYKRSYSGLTNWQQALTKARSVLEDADGDQTFVVFVTDGAPTVYQTNYGTSDKVNPDVAYPYAKTPAYNLNHFKTQNGQNNGSVVATGGNTTLYGVYAFGDEADFLDDLIYYAKDGTARPASQGGETSATVDTTNYYNASDSAALTSSLADIFNSIVNTVGLGEAFIQDGTTQKVETTSGDISTLLEVDENSFEYWMEFPITNNKITRVDPLSGTEYEISLRKDNATGKIIASSTYWGENSDIEVDGELSVGTFKYKWETANKLYNFNPPAATFDKYDEETNPDGSGQVKWPLGKVEENGTVIQEGVGTLLDGVKYTVTFDVYPSQETYDTVASIKNADNAQTAYNNLDANIKKYLKYENGTFTLETNTNATLTYTDTHDGNTTPTTKKYRNPDPVVTVASEMDVEKVWLNQLDAKAAPDNLTLNMNVVRDNVEVSGLSVEVKKSNNWKDSVAIATGLMRTKVVDGKTVVEVLDKGHDYTLTEPVINQPDFKSYQWELQMETVHPMIINGQLTTLIEVPTNEIPSGMASTDEVYKFNGHTFYRFNGKVYYDKVVPTAGQAQTNAQLNAYNIRKSNFNFTKKVEGDPVGGEAFTFTFKVDNTTNEDVWFSVCDPAKLASLGKTCEDADANTYYEREIGVQGATAEEGDTGYFFAPDNTNITLNIKDGWNVRVTNIGTGSTYNITESAPESPFTLTNIDGTVTISVPELPANAVQTSEGVYTVTAADGTVTTYKAVGDHYEYEYTPNTNVQNRTLSGQIIAPNNTYSAVFTNTYPKTHLTVNKVWNVAEDAKKPVEVTLYRSVSGGEKQKVTQTGLTNPVTLNAANNWTYTFKDLDLYDTNNRVYDYFTEESEITGGTYVTTYEGKEDIVVSATDIPANTESIDVNVTIGTETQVVTLNKENNWRVTIPEVNYVNEDGTIKYVSVRSTSSAEIHYALTNKTNTITNEERVNISGTKTWTDTNNQDGLRPETITIHLNADGNGIAETTVRPAQDGSWTYAFNNYPKYKYDEATKTYVAIVYTITEDVVANYTTDIPEGSYDVTNTHIPFETTVTVIKNWNDDDNRDGLRPESVKFKVTDNKGLMIPGFTDNTELSLTEGTDGNWVYTKTGLPRRAAGQEITYSVVEITRPTGYVPADADNEPVVTVEKGATELGAQVFTIEYTNVHTPSVVPISGEKHWSDNDDQDGLRPTSLTVELIGTVYAEDGKTVLETINTGKTATLPNADGSWTYDFGNMPEYQDGYVGRHITYSVRETAVPSGYTETQGPNTYDITNSHTPETITKSGTKTWEDNNNQDGKRPTSITVQLTGKITVTNTDGSTTEQTVETRTIDVVPNAQGAWSYSFAGLPRYANHGQEIVYTVTDTVNGYSATNNSMNLVNTLIPETVDVEGKKIWDDTNNQDGIRPQSITVQLVGQVLDTDGETVLATIDTTGKTATLSEEAGWTYKFEGLQKNINLGTVENPDVREITYTVTDSVDGYTTTSEGYNVKNTHVPETVVFDGLKDWVDNDDQDGKRPESITVRLTGTITKDGRTVEAYSDVITVTAATATEDDDNKWAYEFNPAPKYKDGIEIQYVITEDAVPEYTSTGVAAADGTITNTHTPGKVDVAGSKTWDDANNQDGKRPTSISITLTGTVKYQKDGQEVTEVVRPAVTKTVTANDNWSWSWPGLDKYDNGHEIIYTISETQVTDYNEPVVDGYNVKNTHTPETTKVEGKKTWTDTNDQDGLRPASIDITLSAVVKYTKDGQEVTETARPDETKTVTAAENWSWSWDPLPKYYQGHEIEYTITEGAVNYYESAVTGYDVENTHTPFETTVTVVKNWNDGNNQDGLRPDAITFRVADDKGLMIPGFTDDTELRLTADEGNVWTYTKTGLPRRAAGQEITYSVIEISRPDGYTPASDNEPVVTEEVNAETNAKTFTIAYTNEHTPAVVDVNGSKEWDDDGDRDGIRPTSIKITLTGTTEYEDENGNKVTETVKEAETKTVTAADNWSWSWPNLPKFNKGHEITYTISEEKVAGYNDPEVDGYNVKNTHKPSETSVKVKKVWADDNNRDLIRPTQVLITLYANDAEYGQYPVTINDAINANEWEITIDHLPLNDKGKVITYTAKEKVVSESETDVPAGYTESHSGTTVTNTHTPEPTQISGKKVWKDDSDRDGKRPTSITINVYDEDDKTTIVKSETVSGNNTDEEWSYTISGLNKYKNVNGERKTINYVVDEVLPAGYTKAIDGTTITNTYNTEKKNIPVSKTWVDEKGENYRPTSITVNLLADGVKVDETVLSDENEWKHTFENLPVNKNHGTGTVTYTVEEVETQQIKDYYDVTYPETGEDEGLVIVNTIKDLSKEIPVVKVWDDENNRDKVRPTSITFTLKGTVPSKTDPVYTDSITISTADVDANDANRWVSKFENVPIFHEGTWITYTVEESGVDTEMYPNTTNVTAADGTITLTNSHSHLLKDIVASKAWDDNDDNDGKRPGSVKITLYADGVEQETLEATEDTQWKVTFKDYPVNREGKVGEPIEYTVAETDENIPEGYEPSVDGYTITNSHEPATITYKVTKNWEDFDNNDGKRPDFITVRLVGKVGDTVVKEEVMDVYEINAGFENEPWTYAFTNLPKYYNKELVQYTLTEDKVDLYETEKITFVENTEETTEITNEITNSHDKIPYNENGEITVNKYWYDENDKYKKRPGSITVNLLAFDEVVATAELSEANDWTFTFENLPKYMIKDGEVGVEIVYSIQEVAVPFYQTEIEGFDITNTYNGPVPEITPPNTGVAMTKENGNILFEMILTLLATSYTVVVLRKVNE